MHSFVVFIMLDAGTVVKCTAKPCSWWLTSCRDADIYETTCNLLLQDVA